MAEPSGKHLVEKHVATAYVLVDDRCGETVGLQYYRPKSPGDKARKQLIAQRRERRNPMGRFAEAEQAHWLIGEEFVDGSAEARWIVDLSCDVEQ